MFKASTRIGAAGLLTAALLGGALLLAPAANAASHSVSYGYSSSSEKVKVGSHNDTLKLAKASKSVIRAAKDAYGVQDVYAPAKYKVTLLNAKKHVLYSKTVSGTKALNAFLSVETHKHKSDAALVKELKKDFALSEASAKKSYQSLYTKLNSELGIGVTMILPLYSLQAWVDANPNATTFDGYPDALSGSTNTVSYKITGTPQAYTIVSTDSNTKIWFSLTSKEVAASSKNAVHGHFVLGAVTLTV